MRNVGKHVPKSKAHREYYTKAIKQLDYEPTIDETLKFQESDDNDPDFSMPKSPKKRKVSFKHQFQDHWNENWIKYIIGLITLILFFLMIASKVDISKIDTNVEFLKDDVKELKEAQKKNTDIQHKQDLEIQENRLNIKAIKEKIDDNGQKR